MLPLESPVITPLLHGAIFHSTLFSSTAVVLVDDADAADFIASTADLTCCCCYYSIFHSHDCFYCCSFCSTLLSHSSLFVLCARDVVSGKVIVPHQSSNSPKYPFQLKYGTKDAQQLRCQLPSLSSVTSPSQSPSPPLVLEMSATSICVILTVPLQLGSMPLSCLHLKKHGWYKDVALSG